MVSPSDNNKSSTPFLGWLLAAPTIILMLGVVLLPILFIVVYSFWLTSSFGSEHVYSLSNWHDILTDGFYWVTLGKTLRIAIVTTLLCLLMGYLCAYFIARSKTRHKAVLLILLMLPFWISYIIRTMAWINVLGTNGAINALLMKIGIISEPLQMLYNEGSVILGLISFTLPFMVLNIYISIMGIGEDVENAARSLGANSLDTFTHVLLPLSVPGVAAGSLLVFILSAGSYVTPQILGGTSDVMFAELVYNEIITRANWTYGAALALLLLAILSAIVVAYSRMFDLKRLYSGLS